MIDPMIKAVCEYIAKENGWEYLTFNTSDGKNLDVMRVCINGMYIFLDEGAQIKVFPRSAQTQLKNAISDYQSSHENEKDILSYVKMLDYIFGKKGDTDATRSDENCCNSSNC